MQEQDFFLWALAVIDASAGMLLSRDPGHLGMPGAGIRLASALYVFSLTGLSGEDAVCHQGVPSYLCGEALRLAYPCLDCFPVELHAVNLHVLLWHVIFLFVFYFPPPCGPFESPKWDVPGFCTYKTSPVKAS